MTEIPNDITRTASKFASQRYPNDTMEYAFIAMAIEQALLAERERCAAIAASYARGYDAARQIAEEISAPAPFQR